MSVGNRRHTINIKPETVGYLRRSSRSIDGNRQPNVDGETSGGGTMKTAGPAQQTTGKLPTNGCHKELANGGKLFTIGVSWTAQRKRTSKAAR
jgi:hypothetical protein